MANHKNRRFLALCFACIAEFVTCGIIVLVCTWVRQSNFVSEHSKKKDDTERSLQKLRYRHIAANAVLMLGPLPFFAYAFDWGWKRPVDCRHNVWVSIAGYAFGLFNASALTFTARIMSRVSDVVLALNGSLSMNRERLWLKYGIYAVCYSLTLLWGSVELLMLVNSVGRCSYEMDVRLQDSDSFQLTGHHGWNYYLRHITTAFFVCFLFGILISVLLLSKVESSAQRALKDLQMDSDSLREAKSSLSRLQRIRNGLGLLWVLLCIWFVVVNELKLTGWAVSPLGNSCRNGLVTCAINFVALNYIKPRRKTIMVFEQHLSERRKERKATLLEQQRRDQQKLMTMQLNVQRERDLSPVPQFRLQRGPFAIGGGGGFVEQGRLLNRGLFIKDAKPERPSPRLDRALLAESGTSSTKGTGMGDYGSAEPSESLSTTLLTELTDDSVLNSRWTTLVRDSQSSN